MSLTRRSGPPRAALSRRFCLDLVCVSIQLRRNYINIPRFRDAGSSAFSSHIDKHRVAYHNHNTFCSVYFRPQSTKNIIACVSGM